MSHSQGASLPVLSSPVAPPFSPITPPWSPITPPWSPITPPAPPPPPPTYLVLRPEYRTFPDPFRFCASPDGNAGNLNGVDYLEQILEEVEAERQQSADYWAAVDPTNTQGRLVGALLFPIVPLGLAPVAAPIVAPVVPPVVGPVVDQAAAPVAAARAARPRRRNGGNARGRVPSRRQPDRACKRPRNYKE